ncbi:hypothetical protein [Lentzea sp. NBRC 105346]|uniref:hypothetical protein n=1 Tax=Lentzea sp. NBRC 105346 TaxID=3032205 RepID=UPI002554EB61|nr:hypothetical protein [Lentzea sp. NBRC 105346]
MRGPEARGVALSGVRPGPEFGIEATATLARVGNRSRTIDFEARVVCRSAPARGPSAADVLDPAIVVTRARGVCVVPKPAE